MTHRPVRIQQPPVQLVVPNANGVLEILIKQGEDVGFDGAVGVPRRALPTRKGRDAVGQVVARVLESGAIAACTGPASLAQLDETWTGSV